MTHGEGDGDGTYWRALAQASPDFILVVDLTGTILFVNRVVPIYADRGLVGRKVWEFAVGNAADRIPAKLAEVVASRRAIVYENAGPRPDGSIGWYEVRVIPVIDDGAVTKVLWVSSDISERRRLQEQFHQSQKMEAIGLLAGGVAHDFNNLLGVIMGFGELAMRAVPPGHPVSEHLGEVLGAAKRGGELTRKLLAFSRKQIIQPRPLDLAATVGEFARVMRRILGEDVDLVVADPAAPVRVSADPVQLEQVLMNLWTNARQAMPHGGELRLSMRAVDFDAPFVARNPWARAGEFAEIEVKDTGTGMDEATLARLFEPFFTTKEEGTGLGLATVYGIVQQHDGFLRVESVPGAGTTVRVYLPRELAPAALPAARVTSLVPEVLRGVETVLVAEDEPSLRLLVTLTLSDLGYRVLAARDGEEALALLERHAREVDFAVLDVVMPKLDGRQLWDRMWRVRPDLKALFVTGHAPSSTRLGELLAEEDVPLLEKPFTPLALAASVRRAIDARSRAGG